MRSIPGSLRDLQNDNNLLENTSGFSAKKSEFKKRVSVPWGGALYLRYTVKRRYRHVDSSVVLYMPTDMVNRHILE